MRKLEETTDWVAILVALCFPPGWAAFMSGIMSMILAYSTFVSELVGIVELLWPAVVLDPAVVLPTAALGMMIFVHPTFLITRGSYRAHRFLKIFSLIMIGCLAGTTLITVGMGADFWWLSALGLLFSLLPAWAYRTPGFRRCVDHFARIQAIAATLPRRWI